MKTFDASYFVLSVAGSQQVEKVDCGLRAMVFSVEPVACHAPSMSTPQAVEGLLQ